MFRFNATSRKHLPTHSLSYLTLPIQSALEATGIRLEVHHSLVDLILRVQYEWSILYDFLVQWETCHKHYNHVSKCFESTLTASLTY